MPASNRDVYHSLWSGYLLVGLIVLALVLLAIATALIFFRAGRRGRPSTRRAAHGLEAAWACAIALTVAGLLWATYTAESKTDAVASSPGLVVNVTASRWNWRFEYPAYGIVVNSRDLAPAALTVPAGTRIQFNLTSRDVLHSFWIPATDFKRDAFPRRVTRFDLVFGSDQLGPGTIGRCAEFCGLHHAEMRFYVDVLTPVAFRDWARNSGDQSKRDRA